MGQVGVPGLQSRTWGDLGNEPVMSAVFATFPAIIIVFNLNDVASLEHTKYVGMLHYNGGFGKRGFRKEGWSGIFGSEEECIGDQREGNGHMSDSRRSLSSSLILDCLPSMAGSG